MKRTFLSDRGSHSVLFIPLCFCSCVLQFDYLHSTDDLREEKQSEKMNFPCEFFLWYQAVKGCSRLCLSSGVCLLHYSIYYAELKSQICHKNCPVAKHSKQHHTSRKQTWWRRWCNVCRHQASYLKALWSRSFEQCVLLCFSSWFSGIWTHTVLILITNLWILGLFCEAVFLSQYTFIWLRQTFDIFL